VNMLEEWEDQLSRLAAGSTATDQLAARATQLATRYWELLNPQQRERLRQWLHDMHTESRRTVRSPLVMKERLRRAEVAMSAIEAIKKIASPERG
jgi:hypothetical protein